MISHSSFRAIIKNRTRAKTSSYRREPPATQKSRRPRESRAQQSKSWRISCNLLLRALRLLHFWRVLSLLRALFCVDVRRRVGALLLRALLCNVLLLARRRGCGALCRRWRIRVRWVFLDLVKALLDAEVLALPSVFTDDPEAPGAPVLAHVHLDPFHAGRLP